MHITCDAATEKQCRFTDTVPLHVASIDQFRKSYRTCDIATLKLAHSSFYLQGNFFESRYYLKETHRLGNNALYICHHPVLIFSHFWILQYCKMLHDRNGKVKKSLFTDKKTGCNTRHVCIYDELLFLHIQGGTHVIQKPQANWPDISYCFKKCFPWLFKDFRRLGEHSPRQVFPFKCLRSKSGSAEVPTDCK